MTKEQQLVLVVVICTLIGGTALAINERNDPRNVGRIACRQCGVKGAEFANLIAVVRESALTDEEVIGVFMQTAPPTLLGDQSQCEPCVKAIIDLARGDQ